MFVCTAHHSAYIFDDHLLECEWYLKYLPRTQMTPVLIGKGLVLGGSTFKNRGHLGSRYILLSILSIQKPNAMENPVRFSPKIHPLGIFAHRKILGQNIYPFCNAFLKHSFPFPEIGICEVQPEGICVLAGILRFLTNKHGDGIPAFEETSKIMLNVTYQYLLKSHI